MHTYTYTYTYTHIHIHIYTCVYVSVYVSASLCLCLHLCVCVCVCISMSVSMSVYVSTSTSTSTSTLYFEQMKPISCPHCGISFRGQTPSKVNHHLRACGEQKETCECMARGEDGDLQKFGREQLKAHRKTVAHKKEVVAHSCVMAAYGRTPLSPSVEYSLMTARDRGYYHESPFTLGTIGC